MKGPAPLISIPEAPPPPGGRAEWFEGAGGVQLRAARFPASGEARGSVVVSTGRTESIEKYFETIGDLTMRGYEVLIHDWRGQGLSQRLTPDRLKGHAEGYEDFLADHRMLLDKFGPGLPRPWIALSHSMGACLTLLALVKGEARLSAALLTAPMLGVSTAPAPQLLARSVAALMRLTGQGAGSVSPAPAPAITTFAANRLTHDRARYDRYAAQLQACPDLNLGGPTWGWLDFAFHAGDMIAAPSVLEALAIPVRIVAAGEERLVLNPPIRAAAARLPNGWYLEIAGAYHELLMETDDKRDRVWREFDDLVSEVSAPPA